MSKPELYPLKFEPILKSPLWGGTRLSRRLNKQLGERDICGESWEISGVKNNVSLVADGPLKGKTLVELIDEYKEDLTGKSCYAKFGNKFPLLIKFIDADKDLSIQVHPDDTLAQSRHNSFGKSEMWYVIEADQDATLITGFNRPTSKEEYLEYFNSGRLLELLNKETVQADDVFYLPAGRVHTIGKGLLIAEIQQTSDITYRIYDFERVDQNGRRRELHTEEALDAIDYRFYEEYKTQYDQNAEHVELVSSDYFVTNKLVTSEPKVLSYSGLDSFKILMVLNGSGVLETTYESFAFSPGDSYLVPACLDEITINPKEKSKILEVYLPS